jgi:hypothetical protein
MGRVLVFSAIVLVTAGCRTVTSDAPLDPPDASDDAAQAFDAKSNCGFPGDKGNSLGVGQFCQRIADCSGNTKATLCTTFGDPENFFCTFRCSVNDPPGVCGENARCACGGASSACGCFPTRCDDPSDGGADASDAATDSADAAPDAGDAAADAPAAD